MDSLLLALAGFFAGQSPSPTSNISWEDYTTGQRLGIQSKKFFAVFVGGDSSAGAFGQRLSGDVKLVLAQHFVCAYLDKNDPDNQALLTALAIKKEAGLVVSDRTGVLQAFHHDGSLSQVDLAKNLRLLCATAVGAQPNGAATRSTPKSQSTRRPSGPYYPRG